MTAAASPRRSQRWVSLLQFGLAIVGALAGLAVLLLHLTTDPLADVRAYYEAGVRLNHGLSLYEQAATTDEAGYYRYPPLLAIAFRPLALMPFEAAALLWELAVLGAFAATLWRIGLRNRRTWLALGWLAAPIAWSITIGQAHVITTWLLTLGSPLALALAGHLKIFPALAAIYWVGRRDWRWLGRFAAWAVALVVLSFVLEPAGTLAFLDFPDLAQVGEVNNLSPYALSPILWLAVTAGLVVLSLLLARTRYGWIAAVALSVLANPRLLLYQLMSFLAAVRRPAADSKH